MATPLQLKTFIIDQYVIELYVPQPDYVKVLYQHHVQQNAETAFPYWSKVWPAAIALTQFIFQNTFYIQNKNVLELAAGLGLPSIAAARFAHSVTCSDYLSETVQVAQASMQYNQLKNVYCKQLNWEYLPDNLEANVLLLSDINYNPEAFSILYKVLLQFINKGTTVLLSTPQRLASKPFIESLLPYCIQQLEIAVEELEQKIIISVLVLKKSSDYPGISLNGIVCCVALLY